MTYDVIFQNQEILKDNSKCLIINNEDLVKSVQNLKDSGYDFMVCMFGTDTSENIELIYQLYSTKENAKVNLKVILDRDNPEIDSVSSIYQTANWNERETYDLLGVKFTNHPDLKRILLPEDWLGHPLRKDYVQNDDRLVWNER